MRINLQPSVNVPENAKAGVCTGGEAAETEPLASLQVS